MVGEREASLSGPSDRTPAVISTASPSPTSNAASAPDLRQDPSSARRYHNWKRGLSLARAVLATGFSLAVLTTGFAVDLESLARRITDNDYGALLGFVALFGVLESLLVFPLRILSGFVLEHRFRLSNQTLGQWLWEGIKGMLVGAAIGLPLVVGLYFCLNEFGPLWWLPIGGLLFVVTVMLARIAPTVIFPLFYTFEPVGDARLRERLVALSRRVGVSIEGVFVFNMSKMTKKANAAFAGIGRAKRIILGDTLIANFTDEEIETIFAHELGHYTLRHLWVMLLVGFLSTFVGLAATSVAFDGLLPWFGIASRTAIAGLPLLGLLLSAYSLITSPLVNMVSRSHERAADLFAIQLTERPQAFIDALKKLAVVNMAELQPPPLIEALFHSHPSLARRIRAIERSVPIP